MRRVDRECPTPFKLRFTSRREARLALLDITERKAAKRGGKKVSAQKVGGVYECACGGYHLTKRRNSLHHGHIAIR